MDTDNSNEQFVRKQLQGLMAELIPPPVYHMAARRALLSKTKSEDRPDLISVLAAFLNLRVKLYQVVIAFCIVWFGYLFLQTKSVPRQEASQGNYEEGLAAINNQTVLPCIQTFILKK